MPRVATLAGALGRLFGFVALGLVALGAFALVRSPSSFGCDIKGNISFRTGERIYHVPGQEHYAVTRIDPRMGERWFCTEAEARKAGWRKAWR